MNKTEKISIIMPVYNGAPYLAQAIEYIRKTHGIKRFETDMKDEIKMSVAL